MLGAVRLTKNELIFGTFDEDDDDTRVSSFLLLFRFFLLLPLRTLHVFPVVFASVENTDRVDTLVLLVVLRLEQAVLVPVEPVECFVHGSTNANALHNTHQSKNCEH